MRSLQTVENIFKGALQLATSAVQLASQKVFLELGNTFDRTFGHVGQLDHLAIIVNTTRQ